jgi:biopolymer transport protein TolR
MLRPKKYRVIAEINVVPYIDVMLVLLVIFMITAPLLFQGVDVNLPQARSKPIPTKEQEPIVLSIDARGKYYLNLSKNPMAIISDGDIARIVADELRHSQGRDSHPRQVLIKGDRAINYGKIVQAMILLQNAGATNIGLITKFDE